MKSSQLLIFLCVVADVVVVAVSDIKEKEMKIFMPSEMLHEKKRRKSEHRSQNLIHNTFPRLWVFKLHYSSFLYFLLTKAKRKIAKAQKQSTARYGLGKNYKRKIIFSWLSNNESVPFNLFNFHKIAFFK